MAAKKQPDNSLTNCAGETRVCPACERLPCVAATGPAEWLRPADVAFETARLRVFTFDALPADHNTERQIFVAFRTDEDRPMVCATAVYWPAMNFVDWLEVTSEYRRQGFARELLTGIDEFLGRPCDVSAGSDLGQAFLKAIGRDEEEGAP